MASVLKPRQELLGGQSLTSPNGQYVLAMQTDGNLVLYHVGISADWASNTGSATWGPGTKLVMEFNANLHRKAGDVCWSSNINTPVVFEDMKNRGYLQVQDDGNVVIYEDVAVWAATPIQNPDPNSVEMLVCPTADIAPGFSVTNGDYRLVFQTDGNLVIYKVSTGQAIWNAGSMGGNRLSMQGDGNLVVYKDNTALWNTQTNGRGACYLAFTNYGRLYVRQPQALWSTKTGNLVQRTTPQVIVGPKGEPWPTYDREVYKFWGL